MRTRKKRSGTEPLRAIAAALLMCGAVLAAGADHKKEMSEPHAVVAGSVFRDPGFALAGAEVSIEPRTEGDSHARLKSMKAVSDARGEFAFHVPPVEGHYLVRVTCKGYEPQTKQAEVSGEERVDVNFVLEPKESK